MRIAARGEDLVVVVVSHEEEGLLAQVFDEYFNLQGERIADLLEMGHELEAKRREKECSWVGKVFTELVPDVPHPDAD